MFFANEVFAPQFGWVHLQFVGQNVDGAFDQVARFGDAEAAPVGDTAGHFVGEVRIQIRVSDWEIITAADDAEHACRIFARVGGGIECAVIRDSIHLERGQFALFGRTDFDVHVVITGEARGQVFGAGFDPFDGSLQDQRTGNRADVTGVDRNFVAEAAAQIR